MSFVHLHTHSHYSLLDGLAKIDDLISEAKRLGMPALALTDHGNMYGAVEFYKKAKAAGLKPILGVEAYLAPNSLKDKNFGIDDKRHHLVLLAKNNEGYKNLLKLVSISNLEGFYYKPRIDKEVLKKYAQGLIGLSACLSGEIPKALLAGNKNHAEKLASEYKEIFGEKNFFIEIEHHPNIPNHSRVQKELIELAEKTKTPLVAAQDIHYLKQEDAKAQDVLLAVQTNSKLDDEDRLTMKEDDFSMRSPEQMKEFFSAKGGSASGGKDLPEAIDNTLKIAEQCNVELKLGEIQLPFFKVPDGHTPESYLEYLCQEGLKKRFQTISQEIKERLKYELSVIEKTGFASYFLIVQDFVNWAKNQKIVVGPGRGSAAGSLISYLLNITDIDPLKYNLLFERFINPERISPPDIDLDFADTRRDEVIQYVAKKYGQDRVAQIITFGTMASRAAVRDTGRALGLDYSFCDRIAKTIPFGYSLDKALEQAPELKEFYQNNSDAKKLIDFAKKLEGVARHASTHACGVVITKEPLINSLPLQYATASKNGLKTQTVVTQYGMNSIEDLGLLKMDFLGLANLSIIEETLKRIKKIRSKEINTANLPLNDEKTFKLFSEARTVGVFQLESAGMRRCLKELKPNNLEDIIAMVSLYRPGPMELIPSYIARKHGLEKINYPHSKMEPILNNTYGIMIYQEQLMRIARDLAGFSLAEADILRKAVGKKIKKLLDEQKEKFIKGVEKTIGSNELGQKIWKLIEPFAKYGFNRSHAACYAIIAYQTAYLKAHYPEEFMASLLNANAKDIERISFLVADAKTMNIKVLPPDINESRGAFTVAGGNIRFGLGAVKNAGHNIIADIIAERDQNGPFKSLINMLERIPSKDLNKKSIEALIKSGALDSLDERNKILENMEIILGYHKESRTENAANQSSLFSLVADSSSLPSLKLKPAKSASLEQKLRWEKELLGLYVSGHPVEKFSSLLRAHKMGISVIKTMENNAPVLALGLVEKTKKILTKKGQPMMFLNLMDEKDAIEVVVFPRTLEIYGHLLQDEQGVKIKGKVSLRNGSVSIICDQAEILKSQSHNLIMEKAPQLENKKTIKQVFPGPNDNTIEMVSDEKTGDVITHILKDAKGNITKLETGESIKLERALKERAKKKATEEEEQKIDKLLEAASSPSESTH
ncbi:MAG: DNA polymerase III subunit alpha [Patescibacteria group bacterium]